MLPLIVLLGSFLLLALGLKRVKNNWRLRTSGRWAMAAMLVFSAVGHFLFPSGMAQMIPDFLPARKLLVYLTGALEVVFALGLLSRKYAKTTGWLLIAFLLLVLPANINAAMQGLNYQTGALDGPGINYLWFRIPLQLFFIVWIYLSACKSK